MAICAPSEATVVTMKSGLTVSISALRVLWRLEETGMIVKVDADTGRLLVGPQSRLTTDDVQAIRAHRTELIEMVKMCNAEAM